MFTIRSEHHDKHRIIQFAYDERIAGEAVFHGKFRFGDGTVSIAGSKPIKIEDWMHWGRQVTIGGEIYEWSYRSVRRGGLFQTIFEVGAACSRVNAF